MKCLIDDSKGEIGVNFSSFYSKYKERLGINKETLRKHLRKLEECGLIILNVNGRKTIVKLNNIYGV